MSSRSAVIVSFHRTDLALPQLTLLLSFLNTQHNSGNNNAYNKNAMCQAHLQIACAAGTVIIPLELWISERCPRG